MRIVKLTLASVALMFLAVGLPTNQGLAQQRLVFEVSAENTKYTQQHTVDVGDIAGHQVRVFEIHRTYPSNAPVINGIKIVESWTRGISDYTSNNGEGIVYAVYVLENGDKFFTRGSLSCAAELRGGESRSHNSRTDNRWHGEARQDQRDGTNVNNGQSPNGRE